MDIMGAREERLHQRVVELLPWYVNGTLETAERRTVEGHLPGCPRCRAELAATRDLARAVKEDEAVAPSPHPVQLARLLDRIDAQGASAAHEEPAPRPARLAPPVRPADTPRRRRRGRLLALPPRRLRQMVVAELAAILLLALALAWQRRLPAPPAAPFHTLSSDAPVATAPGTVPLHIIFADHATAGQIKQILAEVGGRIVDGPSKLGVYVVAIPAGPGADPVDIVLAHLKAQPGVEIATRVAGSD